MTKPRSDSTLLNLPEAQQAQLAEWLLDGVPYHRAQEQVAKEFGVKVSFKQLSHFWRDVCGPALLTRRRRAVTTADEIATEAAKTPGRFDVATLDAIKQRAFELSIQPGADPKEIKEIFKILLTARAQDLDAQQLSLDQKRFQRETCELFLKWAATKRASEIANSPSTNAEKIEQLGQLMFGEDWKS